jgi:hypothetical protein
MPHFVLFETSGNQRFIFATNKLAENLGASQMIWQAGVDLVLQAAEQKTGTKLLGDTPAETRKLLRKQTPLGDGSTDIEVVTAASGKAILLVNDDQLGRDLVYTVTSECLKTLPGVDLRGVVGRKFKMSADLDAPMRAVHEDLAALSGTIPGPEFRFLRLPIMAACDTSNLPASVLDRRPEPSLRSEVSYRKRKLGDKARTRFEAALGFRLPHSPEEFEDELKWLAVIHADGNGVGKVFQNFGRWARPKDGPDYLRKLRNFSLALDACTEAAVGQALDGLRKRCGNEELPVIPLVLGGDDLTMLCNGRMALYTAHDFLEAFAGFAAAHRDINQIATITASAGVAIVKPHFPFHLAYELAEALFRSAKKLKPDPAIDFLVHYDTSGGDLPRIRERLHIGDAQLYARPYSISGDAWSAFAEAVKALNDEPADGEDPIPRSLLHELRSALFLGREAGERQLESALLRRGGDARLRGILAGLHGGERLFRESPPGKRPAWRSALLDVLEAQEFWQ